MGIASTVRDYLDEAGVDYQLVHHDYTPNSRGAADAARIPPDQLAKPVLLEDDKGYLVAVVPATRRVALESLQRQLGRNLVLATEREVQDVFSDCSKGAIPAVGQAYGLDVVWDDCLAGCADVYFEAGDHMDLVRMSGKEFTFLMGRRPHGAISAPEIRH